MLNVLLPSFIARDHRRKRRHCFWNGQGNKQLYKLKIFKVRGMPSDLRTKCARAMLP